MRTGIARRGKTALRSSMMPTKTTVSEAMQKKACSRRPWLIGTSAFYEPCKGVISCKSPGYRFPEASSSLRTLLMSDALKTAASSA